MPQSKEGGNRKSQVPMYEMVRTAPPNRIAGMPHACRTPDSGHGNHPMGRYKLSRRYQPQGRRDGNDVRNDMPAQRHTIRNEKILVRGLPMAGIVCYRIIDLGVWRSG